MPVAVDPNQTIKIVLERDMEKLMPPAFLYKPLTSRQWRQVAGLNDIIEDMDGAGQLMDQMAACVKIGLVGWEHMTDIETGTPVEFDPDKIEDVTLMPDLQEIIAQRTTYFSFEDKKKLSSPSDSETATSASDAKAP